MEYVSRFDAPTPLDKLERTPQGGVIIPATLTRTGVLTYYQGNKVIRELRHPDDVFKADSLATLRAAPATIGHPGLVNPDNYGAVTVGHVDTEGRQDGNFVAAPVRVMAAKALKGIENKTLVEVSAGYQCKMDMTPGVYEGQAYDCRQVDIRYNHVALLPKGGGRAGSDVRLRLDSAGCSIDDCTLGGNGLHQDTQGTMTPEQIAALQADNKALKERLDAVDKAAKDAEVEAAKREAVAAATSALQPKLDSKEIDARVAARVALLTEAHTVLDSKDAPYDASGKTDHQVRLEVLARLSPAFKCDGKSEAAIEGAYAATLVAHADARKAFRGEGTQHTPRQDSADAVNKAYNDNIKASQEAYKTGSATRIGASK